MALVIGIKPFHAKAQTVYELIYGHPILFFTFEQPDLQYIQNPAGTHTYKKYMGNGFAGFGYAVFIEMKNCINMFCAFCWEKSIDTVSSMSLSSKASMSMSSA